jgi:RHS repeat-associated protein
MTVATNSSGVKSAEQLYYPWGTARYASTPGIPTSFRFTGQRRENYLDLYWYGSRWYDPSAARFIQADTVVPDPGNSQDWDRYAYTNNNPVKYIDPTGHYGEEVHRDLTYQIVHDAAMNIADEMGFGLNELKAFSNNLASEVVRGDMAADSLNPDGTINPNYLYMNSLTPPVYVSIGGKTIIDEKSPSWYTTPEAIEDLNKADNPFDFGIASHEYQDSFSHWQKLGKPDTPPEIWQRSALDIINKVTGATSIDDYSLENPIDRAMNNGYKVYVDSFVRNQVEKWRFYGN